MSKPYKTIYADPPWNEEVGLGGGRGADEHYQLMSTDDIISLMQAIPISDDAHIYLWVTNSALRSGLKVLDALGFRYVTNLVWVKPHIGLGCYFRGQHELCLFGVKGHPGFKNKRGAGNFGATDEPTVLFADKKGHSQKPLHLYTAIEKTSYPPYVEVFARCRREGWDAIGNQVPNLTQTILIGAEEFQ